MSFEGYYQILCKKGHLSTLDVYDDFEEKQWECRCGAKVAWVNMVDTTNGSFQLSDIPEKLYSVRIVPFDTLLYLEKRIDSVVVTRQTTHNLGAIILQRR